MNRSKTMAVCFGWALLAISALAQDSGTPAEDTVARWKKHLTPEDFLQIANAIPPGSTRETVEERLGKPLDPTSSSATPTRETWIYYRDDHTVCSVEYESGTPASYRGAAISIVAPPPVDTQPGIAALTEENVSALLTSIDTAVQKMDATSLLKCMAEDVIVRIEMPGGPQAKSLQMNRTEYETYLKESYQGLTQYQYERQPSEITISADGKSARATHKIVEKTSRGTKTQTSESMESDAIELRDGRLLITYIDASVLAVR